MAVLDVARSWIPRPCFPWRRDALELVGDVELVRVEEHDDQVHALRKPADNAGEVVAALKALPADVV